MLRILIYILIAAGFALAVVAASEAADVAPGGGSSVRLDTPVGRQTAISFWIGPRESYSGGEGREKVRYELIEVPGVGKCYFQQASDACLLGWDWSGPRGVDWLGFYLPELPGPEWYHVLYTWDAERGFFDAYVNGCPLRVPGTGLKPWSMEPGSSVIVLKTPVRVAHVKVEDGYLAPDEAVERVPRLYRGRRADLFGADEPAEPLDVDGRLGEVLYESSMRDRASLEGWVMEGPGVVEFEDGWMRMSSALVDGEPRGHIVHWCPADFPGSFVADWEIRLDSQYGLCIVFFAAKGEKGEDIFDPALPARDGTFKQYTSGAIVSYHISYYANTPSTPGRGTSNLRKNNHFYLTSNGPPGIEPASKEPHRIRLIKDGARVQMQVDGRVIIDYTDRGERYGAVLGGGKIGLRQMQWTAASYRNFRVRELKPDGSTGRALGGV